MTNINLCEVILEVDKAKITYSKVLIKGNSQYELYKNFKPQRIFEKISKIPKYKIISISITKKVGETNIKD